MNHPIHYIISCNGIKIPKEKEDVTYLELEHNESSENQNVRINLTDFTSSLFHINDRIKDLLEIAGYIFAGDRLSSRGQDTNLEQHSWSRILHFHFKVRDLEFWKKTEVQKLLAEALCFMTGDLKYEFTFHKAGPDFPTSIFDNRKFVMNEDELESVILFSGGLDSFAGALERIDTTSGKLCLISHQSGLSSNTRIQEKVFEILDTSYPDRCAHYEFKCGLTKVQAKNETQRSRSFLYNAMAFAIAHTYKLDKIFVYENGITSINFPETQDQMNGRASRTTHPKTLALLEKFFTAVGEKPFKIEHPFFYKTKTEIVKIIKDQKMHDAFDSTVSCGRKRKDISKETHCGRCSQCIDRRFAVYAAEVEKYDENGIYAHNFLTDDIIEPDIKRGLIDYVRLAKNFARCGFDDLFEKYTTELIDVIDYIDGATPGIKMEKVFNLCRKHSGYIDTALKRMSLEYDQPLLPYRPNSFFRLIAMERDGKDMDDVIIERTDIINATEIKKKTDEIDGNNKLKKFGRGELKNTLKKYVAEHRFKIGETVKSSKVNLITRKLIEEGWDANQTSVAVTLRKLGYGEELKRD